MQSTRRSFLATSTKAGALASAGAFDFLRTLPGVSAAEALNEPRTVMFDPDIEPVVRLLENTPRNALLEVVGQKIQSGLSYQKILGALLLAGVRNIQPRPVGFKFHAVLVVNSAHLASIDAPPNDRWLPIFWALDYFKSSQQRDAQEGDWTMKPVQESGLPSPTQAGAAFRKAMDQWDVSAADTATASVARSMGAAQVFDLFARYGARDFRDIGHKAIYVANSWRALQTIGWRHSEPVLRSLAYALLAHEGGNPSDRDADADRPYRENQKLLTQIRDEWQIGRSDGAATVDLLETLRTGSPSDASHHVVDLLNSGISPNALWDGLFQMASELLMRRPGIVALHAVTTTNAIRFAFDNVGSDELRRLLLLQNAAFLPMFRGAPDRLRSLRLDDLSSDAPEKESLESVFTTISDDRPLAAKKALAYLNQNGHGRDFINHARRLIFLKGSNSHDYKFSSAALEDYFHISPEWRNRFLAASVFNLRGEGDSDNGLIERARDALKVRA